MIAFYLEVRADKHSGSCVLKKARHEARSTGDLRPQSYAPEHLLAQFTPLHRSEDATPGKKEKWNFKEINYLKKDHNKNKKSSCIGV